MIELRWKRIEPTPIDGYCPDHTVTLDDGLAVLQYREGELMYPGPDEYVDWGEWTDVEIRGE